MKKNDLVYIPVLGVNIYTVEDVRDGNVIIRHSMETQPTSGNYRTGYLTNEGRVLLGEMPDDVSVRNASIPISEVSGATIIIPSRLVYEANLRTHRLLEELTGEKYQVPHSPIQVALKLLEESPIICKAGNDIKYKELLKTTEFKLIVRYDEALFYDVEDKSYTLVIPVDGKGEEIKHVR